MTASFRRVLALAFAAALTIVCLPGQAAKPEFKKADSRELPSYVIPNIPVAAEAYWAPDSRHLIAQTHDPDAIPSNRGGEGNLTYIFTDDGEEIWRVNDRGQDACSYFFPGSESVSSGPRRATTWICRSGDWTDPDNYPHRAENCIHPISMARISSD